MRTVSMQEAKTHLSIQEVIDGRKVVIARDNVPLVELALLDSARKKRVLGTAKGKVTFSADFDEVLVDFDVYC